MTTNTTAAEDRLARLGIHLPEAPTPFGAYVPAVQTGNLLFLSGMLATSGHAATAVGVVGKDLDVKAGREAAHTAALNVLALTKKQLGSLNRVSHVVIATRGCVCKCGRMSSGIPPYVSSSDPRKTWRSSAAAEVGSSSDNGPLAPRWRREPNREGALLPGISPGQGLGFGPHG